MKDNIVTLDVYRYMRSDFPYFLIISLLSRIVRCCLFLIIRARHAEGSITREFRRRETENKSSRGGIRVGKFRG